MSKTITITDGTVGELLGLVTGASIALSVTARDDLRLQLAPPVIVVPPAAGPIPTSIPGYTRVIAQEWTWGTPFPTLTTSGWDGKSIIIIGVTVPPGIPAEQRTMTLTEQDGRPGVLGTEREVCLARTPGAFVTDIDRGYNKSYNPSLILKVGAPQRATAYMEAGRYFINAKWSDPSNARMQI